MINNINVEKTKKEIKKSDKPILVKSQNSEYNRKMLEYGNFDSLINIENSEYKDSPRNINSGLNEIIARIANKNKISLKTDLSELRLKNKKEKGECLKKLIQNIKIARKTGVKIGFLGIKDPKNTSSLMISLKASSKQAKQAISF